MYHAQDGFRSFSAHPVIKQDSVPHRANRRISTVERGLGTDAPEAAISSYEKPGTHLDVLPAIESSFAMVSGLSLSVAAWRFSRRCLTEDVPGISRMLGAR